MEGAKGVFMMHVLRAPGPRHIFVESMELQNDVLAMDVKRMPYTLKSFVHSTDGNRDAPIRIAPKVRKCLQTFVVFIALESVAFMMVVPNLLHAQAIDVFSMEAAGDVLLMAVPKAHNPLLIFAGVMKTGSLVCTIHAIRVLYLLQSSVFFINDPAFVDKMTQKKTRHRIFKHKKVRIKLLFI